ncbi:MAG: zf-HC2 domain-containing protein [Candidatus Angelobacter sp.]
MNTNFQNGLECSEFEAHLADALDETLAPETRQAFEAHGRSCGVCGPLWAEAREGMLLVRGMEELEPPKNLVHNILAATSRKDLSAKALAKAEKAGWPERLRETLRRNLHGSLSGAMHSRFAMSFAMAFFSLSFTLTLAGVRFSDVKNVDWHPNALRKSVVLGFTQVEAKVASYYENLRLVYEVQARVRELKKNTSPAPGTNDNKQQNRKSAPDDGGRPQQQENYSRERDGSQIAQSNRKSEGAQI